MMHMYQMADEDESRGLLAAAEAHCNLERILIIVTGSTEMDWIFLPCPR